MTFLDGQISTLPMQPTRIEYDFLAEADDGTMTTGKVALWAEGNFVKGYLEASPDYAKDLNPSEIWA